jgi:hypothetical protein
MRIFVSLVVAGVLLVGAGPAHAAWPSLAGSTTIEGSKSGYATVKLDRPVELDMWDGIPLKISGGGRFYGVSLRQEGARGEKGFSAIALLGEGMESFESDRMSPWVSEEDFESERETVTLPAGLYRLHLIADGKPVRATLSLPLSGSTSVTPNVPVRQTTFELPRIEGSGPRNISSFGGEATMGSEGMWALRVDLDERNSTRTDIEDCVFAPGETAATFGPGCGDPQWLAESRVVWEAEGLVFTAAETPFWAPFWAEYAVDSLGAGHVPYVPGSPVQAPYSGKYSFLWSRNRFAKPGKWLLGGNIQIYGEPSSTASMSAIWVDYDAAPGTPLPKEPADAAPAPSAPAAAPAPSPAPAAAPAAETKAAASRAALAAKKKAAAKKKCAKKRGKKAKRRAACAKKKRAAKKRRPRHTAPQPDGQSAALAVRSGGCRPAMSWSVPLRRRGRRRSPSASTAGCCARHRGRAAGA